MQTTRWVQNIIKDLMTEITLWLNALTCKAERPKSAKMEIVSWEMFPRVNFSEQMLYSWQMYLRFTVQIGTHTINLRIRTFFGFFFKLEHFASAENLFFILKKKIQCTHNHSWNARTDNFFDRLLTFQKSYHL